MGKHGRQRELGCHGENLAKIRRARPGCSFSVRDRVKRSLGVGLFPAGGSRFRRPPRLCGLAWVGLVRTGFSCRKRNVLWRAGARDTVIRHKVWRLDGRSWVLGGRAHGVPMWHRFGRGLPAGRRDQERQADFRADFDGGLNRGRYGQPRPFYSRACMFRHSESGRPVPESGCSPTSFSLAMDACASAREIWKA